MRLIFCLFTLALSFPAYADGRVGRTFSCVTTLETVHQDSDKKPSFQRKPDGLDAVFSVKVKKVTEPDTLSCDDTKKLSRFLQGYCSLPYEAVIDDISVYGDDGEIFRGRRPWHYFAFFPDNHFIWSEMLSGGVIVRTGSCKQN